LTGGNSTKLVELELLLLFEPDEELPVEEEEFPDEEEFPEEEELPLEVPLLRGGGGRVEFEPLPFEWGIVKLDWGTSLHSAIRGLVKSLWYLSRRLP
jgi:hypothetical protein